MTDTQDSQAYCKALRAELHVATISPILDRFHNDTQEKLAFPQAEAVVNGHSAVELDALEPVSAQTSAPNIDNAIHTPADACIEVPQSRHSSHEPATAEEHRGQPRLSTQHHALLLNGRPEPAGLAAPVVAGKMDGSQQTPTQPNEDRDYDEVCHSLPSSGAHDHARPLDTANDERTLLDDESGAVNFGNLSELNRPSSQVSEDGGFENTRGNWRSQQFSSHAYTPFKNDGPLPETPALPKNPFGAKPNIAVPFAGSQLFGQTQFSSAVKPNVPSPTSSRPSPHILHNSISPNIAESSPLKDRHTVSSPTDIRTSSPQRLDEVPATVCRPRGLERIEEETPSIHRSIRDEAIPQSPTIPAPRSSVGHRPLANYESMKTSQDRKLNMSSVYDFMGSESDDDETRKQFERRRKVEKKKAQAAQEMGRVSFTPLQPRDATEPPSRKKRRTAKDAEVLASDTTPKHSGQTKSSNEHPLVVDSQRKQVSSNPAPIGESTQGTEDPAAEEQAMDIDNNTAPEFIHDVQPEVEDRIPATSPAPSSELDEIADTLPQDEPDLPKLEATDPKAQQDNDTGTSSLPPAKRLGGRKARPLRRNTVVTSSASEFLSKETAPSTDRPSLPPSSPASTPITDQKNNKDPLIGDNDADEETPTVSKFVKASEKPSQAVQKTVPARQRGRTRKQSIHQVNDEEGGALSETSNMSSLSSAPSSAAKTDPTTRGSPESDRAESVNLPSPGGRRSLRKKALETRAASASPQPHRRLARAAKQRAPHYGSQSTDDVAPSPSPSVMERSMVPTKASRNAKHSMGAVGRLGRLFDGMVFAISLQSNKSNAASRTRLETKIAQAGGVVLSEGFEGLFERSSAMQTTTMVFDDDEPLTLSKGFGETGFTALIADAHSRKAKYMQALALGLPCLAHQWITVCLAKNQIVDWEPYLLCAGASAVLDYALRSRTLSPYPAIDAQLTEVVDQRRKLLEGQKVLVVVDSKKGRSEAKQPYIFLTKALGPSLSRVFTMEQAREALSKHAKKGTPFGWVYVDKATGSAENLLSAPDTGAKKRKRNSAGSGASVLYGNIRVLNDELVVQSLILGRMVEEDEITF